MSFRVVYSSGVLDVFYEERHVIHQPFHATDTGLQEPWANEEEAVAWWNSIKEPYEVQFGVNQVEGK
jgi:hypothetical protein